MILASLRSLVFAATMVALFGCSDVATIGSVQTDTTTKIKSFKALSTIDVPAPGEKMETLEAVSQADILVPGPIGEQALGSADAPVTVVEYASLTCPHCRAFHATSFDTIKKTYIDTGKVRWILREFPIGRASGTAWIVTRCAPAKDYFKLYTMYLEQQANWVSQEVRRDEIFAVAAQIGMTRAQFDACLANQELETQLTWVKQRGRQLGVSGTPTFFIGTEKVRRPLTVEEFKAFIEPQLAGKIAAR
jgi:protein-disulfide isomerase